MAEVVFFLAAIGAIAGAVGTVALRNPFYAVLALVCHLLALAALFLLLRAEFVAAAQVVVYAGAVMVLYVFVVAYVGDQDQPLSAGGGRGALRVVSLLFAGALFVELCIAVLGSGLAALGTEGAGIQGATGEAADTGFGTAAEMGRLFLTHFLVAFEAASMLLLVAAVGAVILARRRGGLADPRELSVADVLRSHPPDAGTRIDAPRGTMIEAGGPPER
jgi:NADH:ubiquinone oxidoreductase subunit 6 (subunit J)